MKDNGADKIFESMDSKMDRVVPIYPPKLHLHGEGAKKS